SGARTAARVTATFRHALRDDIVTSAIKLPRFHLRDVGRGDEQARIRPRGRPRVRVGDAVRRRRLYGRDERGRGGRGGPGRPARGTKRRQRLRGRRGRRGAGRGGLRRRRADRDRPRTAGDHRHRGADGAGRGRAVGGREGQADRGGERRLPLPRGVRLLRRRGRLGRTHLQDPPGRVSAGDRPAERGAGRTRVAAPEHRGRDRGYRRRRQPRRVGEGGAEVAALPAGEG